MECGNIWVCHQIEPSSVSPADDTTEHCDSPLFGIHQGYSVSNSFAVQMLRSSVSRSLGQGRLQQQLARYVPPNRVLAPQRRHYQPNFIEKVAASFKLPKLKQTAEANPNNEYAVAEYIKLLAGVDPNGARVYIERGWQAGTLPMNENFLRTYLQAVANMGKLDSLHVTGLLNMLNKNGNSSAAPAFSASVASNSAAVGSPGPNGSVSLGSIFGSASTVGAAGGSFGAGNSPNNPLHVTVSEYNWKGQLGKVVGFALCAFITYVLVLSAMDEKAPGAAPGGGVGGNPFSRFGMSSAVHQVRTHSFESFERLLPCYIRFLCVMRLVGGEVRQDLRGCGWCG